VHVGGILRSQDHGESWQPTIEIGADVHQVTTGHGNVYAAGAGGLSVAATKERPGASRTKACTRRTAGRSLFAATWSC